MRWMLVTLAAVALLGCEEKTATPPAPEPMKRAEPVAPRPVAAAEPVAMKGVPQKPSACGWSDVRPGLRLFYRMTSGPVSGGGVQRVGGEIVSAGGTDGPSFDLRVVARQGDRAWAKLAFDRVKLPDGLPAEFLMEIHTGPRAGLAQPWVPPHDAVRPSQLTAGGQTFACEDHVKSPPNAAHTCIQPGPTCLYWLDGLARRWSFPSNDVRQMLELADFVPGREDAEAPPVRDGEPFAGSWYRRTDPLTAERIRYFIDGGQLVREVTPYKLPHDGTHIPPGDAFQAEGATFMRDGPPHLTSTSFRQWVLDILDGKPIPADWIPARSASAIAFKSFPD